MNIQDTLNDFILASQADGLSPNTIKWYGNILSPVVNWLGQDRSLDTITTNDLRSYIVHLRGRDRYEGSSLHPQEIGTLLSEESVASHITAMHRLFNWIADEYELNNPMQRIKRPKRPPKQPKAINQADFIRLFESTSEDVIGTRDRALLCLLADTGARLGGIASLTLHQVESGSRKAHVIEKGNKARWIYWTKYTQLIVNQWLAHRLDGNPSLWVSMNTGERITPNGIYQILKRLKLKAGVRGRCNPHSFRHNFARCYLEAGGDIATLAKLLGHTDVNLTAWIYAIFTNEELLEMHNKKSPITQWLNLSNE